MRFKLFACLFAFCALGSSHGVRAKEKPFPAEILSAHSIAVVGHHGPVPSDFDPTKGDQLKQAAVKVLRDSGRFSVIDDPDKADLVFLVLDGYSGKHWGFVNQVAVAAVFPGGGHSAWNPVALWILEKTISLTSRSAPAILAKELLKQLGRAEQKGPATAPATADKEPEATQPDAEPKEEAADASASPTRLAAQILKARKVFTVLREDALAPADGEKQDKQADKEIEEWKRFSLVQNPADADLIFVFVKFIVATNRSRFVYENLVVFQGGAHAPAWKDALLWHAMDWQRSLVTSPGKSIVKELHRQIEAQEKNAAPAQPTH